MSDKSLETQLAELIDEYVADFNKAHKNSDEWEWPNLRGFAQWLKDKSNV